MEKGDVVTATIGSAGSSNLPRDGDVRFGTYFTLSWNSVKRDFLVHGFGFFLSLIALILTLFLGIGPWAASLIHVGNKAQREHVTIGDYFRGFQHQYCRNFLAGIIYLIIILIVSVPYRLVIDAIEIHCSQTGTCGSGPFIGAAIINIIGFIVQILTIFSMYWYFWCVVADENSSAIAAIRVSSSLAWTFPLQTLLFHFATEIFVIIGFLCLLLGIFWAIPVIIIAEAQAFNQLYNFRLNQ